MKTGILLFLSFLLFAFSVEAQVNVRPLQIPVQEGNNRLKLAWAGGLQAPQFSKIDLNADGILDLIIFDRSDNSLLPFLNNGQASDTAYTFAPEYAAFFPQDLHNWVLFQDYNCDGKTDIFTAGTSDNVRVFKNISTTNQLAFQPVKRVLRASNGLIQIPGTDIPSFTDIDNDGDLDLVAFTSNSDFVTWFRNMRVENGQTCTNDTLNFFRQTSCWGKFEEDFFTSNILLNQGCGGNRQSQKTQLHSGSTFLVFDADNDGDKDALVGDISGDKLTFLQNGGTPVNANMVSQTNVWPPANPLSLYAFPAPYFLDVDNDQKNDLLVAPNNGGDGGSKNFEQVYYYRNTGTNTSPVFTFQKNNFLNGEMIEVGAAAAPAFLDYDRDGDLDLVIGNDNYTVNSGNVKGQLALYQNTGTSATPFYNLISRDFANISPQNLLSLTPTFGDLDGDNDKDMLLGESQGFVWYFRNDALPGQPATFTFVSNNYLNQSVGANSTPFLIDIDRDGDLDLIIGERNGNLNFFRNNGTVSSPSFSLVTTTFGNVSVRNPNIGAGYAAPAVADLNQNNLYDLVVGDLDGKIHYYPDIENNLAGNFAENALKLFNSLTNTSDTLKPGRRAFLAIANLTNDNLPDLITGNGRGGLRCFRNSGLVNGISKAKSQTENWQIFPNPFSGNLNLKLAAGSTATIKITDLLGRECYKNTLPVLATETTLNLSTLPEGVYLISLSRENGTVSTRKILKINRGE